MQRCVGRHIPWQHSELAIKSRTCCRHCSHESEVSIQALLTSSALSSGRLGQHAAPHPFLTRRPLQHQRPSPHKPHKRSFTQLHLDVGQVCAIACNMLSDLLKGTQSTVQMILTAHHSQSQTQSHTLKCSAGRLYLHHLQRLWSDLC